MTIKSDRVKRWRKNFKEMIVKAAGGSCKLCGYSKCYAALSFHHKDPSKKDFALGSIRANPKSISKIILELEKCILLCNNCHQEVHYEQVDISNIESTIDYNYLNLLNNKEMDECPMCNSLKPKHNKYCSLSCSSRSRWRIDWDNINLIKELKTKSFVKIADELGCSDVSVRKRYKKLLLLNK